MLVPYQAPSKLGHLEPGGDVSLTALKALWPALLTQISAKSSSCQFPRNKYLG